MTDPSVATYATLADVRRIKGEPQEINANDHENDVTVMECLRWATRYIEQQTQRSYFPTVETRYFDSGDVRLGGDAAGYTLELGDDNRIIEVTGVTNGDGTSISSSDYRLYPRIGTPYTSLRLLASAWTPDILYGARDAIAITGRWESSDRKAAGWITVYDTVRDNPLLIGGTSVTFLWDTDFDPLMRTPRFSAGMLLRFGTSSSAEYAALLRTNYYAGGTSTGNIRRAERGTTAAEWAQGTAISVWEVDPVIRQACAELAAWAFDHGQSEDGIPEGLQKRIGGAAPRFFVRVI